MMEKFDTNNSIENFSFERLIFNSLVFRIGLFVFRFNIYANRVRVLMRILTLSSLLFQGDHSVDYCDYFKHFIKQAALELDIVSNCSKWGGNITFHNKGIQ